MSFEIVDRDTLTRRGKAPAASPQAVPHPPQRPATGQPEAFELIDPTEFEPPPLEHYVNLVSPVVDHLLDAETRDRIREANDAYDAAHVLYCEEVRYGTKAPITERLWWDAHYAWQHARAVWIVAWGGKPDDG